MNVIKWMCYIIPKCPDFPHKMSRNPTFIKSWSNIYIYHMHLLMSPRSFLSYMADWCHTSPKITTKLFYELFIILQFCMGKRAGLERRICHPATIQKVSASPHAFARKVSASVLSKLLRLNCSYNNGASLFYWVRTCWAEPGVNIFLKICIVLLDFDFQNNKLFNNSRFLLVL